MSGDHWKSGGMDYRELTGKKSDKNEKEATTKEGKIW